MEVKRRLRSAELVATTLAIVLPGFAIARALAPAAALPTELPALASPRSEVRTAIDEDRALAAAAPQGALEAARRSAYLELGRAELRELRPEESADRRAALRGALAALVAEHGEDVIARVRAKDVERMVRALAGEGSIDERSGEIGAFADALERWSAAIGGHRVADEFVVRTLFAARWNVLHGLGPTEGLDRPRLRAYHGWLALHADAASYERRLEALDAYAALGGMYANEARGVLAWRAGDEASAADAFARAYELGGSLRLRNWAIAATAQAGSSR